MHSTLKARKPILLFAFVSMVLGMNACALESSAENIQTLISGNALKGHEFTINFDSEMMLEMVN